MTSNQNLKSLLVGLSGLAAKTASAAVLPSWSDLFSGLQPHHPQEYKSSDDFSILADQDLLDGEEGTARLGFVQLNSGATGFNATINLTGHILLGLGIASALLMYMFIRAFDQGDGGSGYGSGSGYGRKKRSLLDPEDEISYVLPMLEKMEAKLEAGDVIGEECFARATCEAVRPRREKAPKFGTLGNAVIELYRLIQDLLNGGSQLPRDETVLRHLRAMNIGSQGKDCKAAFAKCEKSLEDILKVLAKY